MIKRLAGHIAEGSNSSCELGCGRGDPGSNPGKDGELSENCIAWFSQVIINNFVEERESIYQFPTP